MVLGRVAGQEMPPCAGSVSVMALGRCAGGWLGCRVCEELPVAGVQVPVARWWVEEAACCPLPAVAPKQWSHVSASRPGAVVVLAVCSEVGRVCIVLVAVPPVV